jgi:hypothetical protein
MAGIGHPLVPTLVNAGVIVVDVVIFLSTCSLRAHRVKKLSKLAVSHLVSIDKKLIQIHFVLRPFVFGPVVASH